MSQWNDGKLSEGSEPSQDEELHLKNLAKNMKEADKIMEQALGVDYLNPEVWNDDAVFKEGEDNGLDGWSQF